jgi:hypothetical protein
MVGFSPLTCAPALLKMPLGQKIQDAIVQHRERDAALSKQS